MPVPPYVDVKAVLGKGNLSYRGYLEWINSTLDTKYSKLEELTTGSAYCQLLNKIAPHKINTKKITLIKEFPAVLDETLSRRNLNLLKDALSELGVKVFMKGGNRQKDIEEVEVDRMFKACSYPAHFAFLQWFKPFYDKNIEALKKEAAKNASTDKDAVRSKDNQKSLSNPQARTAGGTLLAQKKTSSKKGLKKSDRELDENQAFFYMIYKSHETSRIAEQAFSAMSQKTNAAFNEITEKSEGLFTVLKNNSEEIRRCTEKTLTAVEQTAEEIRKASLSLQEAAEKLMSLASPAADTQV